MNFFVCFFSILLLSCHTTVVDTVQQQKIQEVESVTLPPRVVVGAERMSEYWSDIEGANIALVVNQTSTVDGIHLVDALLQKGIGIKKIFSPEHGFRGTADAGEKVTDGKDAKTGLPIFSLYGKNKKPSAEVLKDVDVVIFDIQDVGARFYTYISTMHYVMEACAENGVSFLVLDRPNPNGHYVDGPILQPKFKSFVGMHPVPVVHGMTIGEYAQMLAGERWLNPYTVNLKVVKCLNYTHQTAYELPIKPSPNLPNNQAIYLYPSLCFFEGTKVSVGRGTDFPFQVYGHPDLKGQTFSFTPVPTSGAKYPKHQDKNCYGQDLRNIAVVDGKLNLDYLINTYQQYPNKESFFLKNLFFDKLAGTDQLRKQIIAGMSETSIRASWESDLTKFREIRQKYLLYE